MILSFPFLLPLALVIVALICIGLHNKLIKKFHKVEQSFSNLKQALNRRNSNLKALEESDPKNSSNDKKSIVIQATLNELEEQLAASRRSYQAAVYEYNKATESFPSNLIAMIFGFGRVENTIEEKEEELILKDLEKTKMYEELGRDHREHKN